MVTITALGAIVGLIIAILLIMKKVNPAYALILGSVIGGLIGGASVKETVGLMMSGAQSMIPAILRILTAGILAGVLIETGAAKKIAETIVSKLGESKAIFAIVISTTILTMVGVFVDVSVITVAPIAMAIAKRTNLSRTGVLIAMVGGGKAGNIMSPNPNSIAAADVFKVPLTSVMAAGIIPAIFGIIVSVIIAKLLSKKGSMISDEEVEKGIEEEKEIEAHGPSFLAAILGPLVAIIILVLRPLFGIVIDPLIALPVGGFIGCLAMGKIKNFNGYCAFGLGKMVGVAILLLGTGTLSGIIANSALKTVLTDFLASTGAPAFVLAPLAGILMSGATASTTSGTAVGSQVFGPTLLSLGVPALNSAAMIHSGATVLDHLPHGSFFHATGGSVNMDMKERLALIPFESLVGLTLAVVSTIIYGILF